jgi:predicted neuraminidase
MNRSRRSSLLLAIVLFIAAFASLGSANWLRGQDGAGWKLQQLKYNHPGLTVDLGVGLWAWPMPIDYNKDGKTDLVVACPDKPSNGVWFFENAGQPGEKMPVFKPSVRIGAASQNMQVSYVAGRPRVLVPGAEHIDFESSNFKNPTKIYSRSNIHGGPVRANMWRYVDFDGDGNHDLIVGVGDWSDLGWDHAYDSQGEWQNGPLHGYVYLIKNNGTDDQPQYSETPDRLTTADGSLIDVFGWPSPNFADFDKDGDLDLLCGEFLDGFTYFENIGTRTQPSYATGRKMLGSDGQPLVMHVQMITPTAFDWTGDGFMDLIVGDEDGRVALVEHSGKVQSGMPIFQQPTYFQQQADSLKFGALATPFVVDWDKDGLEDILCGNTAGNIAWFKNLGLTDSDRPQWGAPVLLKEKISGGVEKPFRIMAGPSGSIQGPCEAKWGYTCLSSTDWDRDGRLDIVYNSILGRIGLLRGTDNPTLVERAAFDTGIRELPPKWYWWQSPQSDTLTQWRTTPLALDFTGDGHLDLVGLDQQGYLTLRKDGRTANRIFVDEDNQPIRLTAGTCGRSGRVKLAMGDWDSDGRIDLLVNSKNATWYRNCAERDGRIVLKKVDDLTDRDVSGHTCSPTLGRFDSTGKQGLVIGAEDGFIYYIRHDDCKSFPVDQLNAKTNDAPPAQKYAGLVSEEFIYEKSTFPSCHASTIVETSRGLVAAWFGGTHEKHPDVGIWSSFHDGNGWSAPVEWANGVQHDGKRHPCWNPVLFQPPGDAPTMLFFKVGPTPSTWWGEMMLSYDRGRTFRDRVRLPEGIDGPVRCKPILLPGQQLLSGSSTEYDGWVVHFEKTQLIDGRIKGTWKRIGPIHTKDEFNAIQPTFLTHPNGKIQVLCRTKEGVVATSFSNDAGETWSKMEGIDLPNNNSGIEAVTLSNGRHLLIYNHLENNRNSEWGKRGMLNLAISTDGISWRKVAVLEQESASEFSYPAIIQTSDGLVHMTWTWKRQRVKHVTLDPSKIEVGEVLSKNAW